MIKNSSYCNAAKFAKTNVIRSEHEMRPYWEIVNKRVKTKIGRLSPSTTQPILPSKLLKTQRIPVRFANFHIENKFQPPKPISS